jgi:hypothetical protein
MLFKRHTCLSWILLSVCGAAIVAAAIPEFVVTPSLPVDAYPSSIVTADFDGDGRLDIAVLCEGGGTNEIDVLLGNGTGGFSAPKRQVLNGYILHGMAVGDFNGDHRPDLVVGSGPGAQAGFEILLNSGGGNFSAARHVVGATGPRGIAVGDFNHDGHLDVVLADDSGVIVYLGHGNGTFAAPKTLSSGTGFNLVLVDDVNRDGNLDLVASFGTGIQVFLGLGDGNFQAPKIHSFGGVENVESVGLGDFNEDGKTDVAVGLVKGYFGASQILVLNGRGDGTFAGPGSQVNMGPGVPVGMVVGDFNRDGHLDVMVASSNGNGGVSGGNSANVILGDGNGTFRAPELFNVGTDPVAIDLADFNNDGKLDAAVANLSSGSVSILMGTQNGIFKGAREFVSTPCAASVLSGDLNGDKNLDLVTINLGGCYNGVPAGYSILKGNGDGTFQPAVTVNTGTPEPFSGVLADFNGDKLLDLAIVDISSNTVYIYLGHGDATFSLLTSYVVGTSPVFVINADLNKDGHQDLVVVNQNSNTVSVLLGTGGGFFQSPVNYAVGPSPNSVAIADLNRDGHLDLAVANDDHTISLLHGVGNGTFSSAGTLATGGASTYVVAADLNLDGAADLIVSDDSNSTVSVFLNNGVGGFSRHSDYAVGASPYFILAKDLNGDGAPDLAVSVASAVTVLRNNGSGVFGTRQDYGIGGFPGRLAGGDFNHDGFVDLAMPDSASGTVTTLINTKH